MEFSELIDKVMHSEELAREIGERLVPKFSIVSNLKRKLGLGVPKEPKLKKGEQLVEVHENGYLVGYEVLRPGKFMVAGRDYNDGWANR